MWYALASLMVLVAMLVLGRLLAGRGVVIEPVLVDAESAAAEAPQVAPAPLPQYIPQAEPVALRPAPGAPNIDPPTDRHVSARGTATIHKRTGRRTSTGAT